MDFEMGKASLKIINNKKLDYELPFLWIRDNCPCKDCRIEETKEKRFIEAIDLLPTFLDAVESPASKHRLEGNSLMPIIKGDNPKNWKDFVFSEIDYSFNEARKILNLGASDARAFMIRNNEWKYIYYKGFEPQLFDLKNDPDEFNDLGRSKDHSKIREEMKELLLKRIIDRKNRIAATDEFVTKERDYTKDDGIMIGVW